MDYGYSTKRFGNYTLNNEDINDAKQAEEFVTDLFHNEFFLHLPYLSHINFGD